MFHKTFIKVTGPKMREEDPYITYPYLSQNKHGFKVNKMKVGGQSVSHGPKNSFTTRIHQQKTMGFTLMFRPKN